VFFNCHPLKSPLVPYLSVSTEESVSHTTEDLVATHHCPHPGSVRDTRYTLSVGDGPSNPSSRSSSASGMFHFMHYKIYLTPFAGRASQRGSPATRSRGHGRSPEMSMSYTHEYGYPLEISEWKPVLNSYSSLLVPVLDAGTRKFPNGHPYSTRTRRTSTCFRHGYPCTSTSTSTRLKRVQVLVSNE
jgi:hypothetical protein